MKELYILCAIDGKPFRDSRPIELTKEQLDRHNNRDSEVSGTFFRKCRPVVEIID